MKPCAKCGELCRPNVPFPPSKCDTCKESIPVVIVRPLIDQANFSFDQPSTSGPPRERTYLPAAEVNQPRGGERGAILQMLREAHHLPAAEVNRHRGGGRGAIIQAIRERENQRARENR